MRAGMHLIVTFELEARAARQFAPNDFVIRPKRRSAIDVGRPVNSNYGSANSNRYVHQAAVITNERIASLDERGHLLYSGLACRNAHTRTETSREVFYHFGLAGRPEQNYLRIGVIPKQSLDHHAIPFNGPLLPAHRRRSARLHSYDSV
jgi:hypothetical protein